MPQAVCG